MKKQPRRRLIVDYSKESLTLSKLKIKMGSGSKKRKLQEITGNISFGPSDRDSNKKSDQASELNEMFAAKMSLSNHSDN